MNRTLLTVTVAAIVGTVTSIAPFESASLEKWWRARTTTAPKPLSKNLTSVVPSGVIEPQPIGTDSSVSKTPRFLLLTATRPGRNSRDGYALIGVSDRSPQTYRVGSLLANGARIQEIYSDHVVLERAGQTTQLYLAGYPSPETSPASLAMISVGGTTQAALATADSGDSLTDYIRISPAFEGTQFQGLVVFANPRSDAFFRMGLREGDVITAVDETVSPDQESALAALRPLIKGHALSVTVQRDGHRQVLSLDGSLIM